MVARLAAPVGAESFNGRRPSEGTGLDDVGVAEEVGTIRRAEDGDVGFERAGGLALAQELEVGGTAGDAQALGLPLYPQPATPSPAKQSGPKRSFAPARRGLRRGRAWRSTLTPTTAVASVQRRSRRWRPLVA
jgi:hypothetical protein